jgi:hypothetical protein
VSTERLPAHLIPTSLQRGVIASLHTVQPFQRFGREAVETAKKVFVTATTSLKRGVNEKDVLV